MLFELETTREIKECKVLDATCGSKMMWFDKNNEHTVYADNRCVNDVLCDGRVLSITPDLKMDFTCMPFANHTFNLVVFDPPHLNDIGKNSWLAKKYGCLLPTWEADLKAGFDECMRVLKPDGVLIFKWNERRITTKKIIELIGMQPLFGHTTSTRSHTIWMTFIKIGAA